VASGYYLRNVQPKHYLKNWHFMTFCRRSYTYQNIWHTVSSAFNFLQFLAHKNVTRSAAAKSYELIGPVKLAWGDHDEALMARRHKLHRAFRAVMALRHFFRSTLSNLLNNRLIRRQPIHPLVRPLTAMFLRLPLLNPPQILS
jgi:hypothetical protein